VFKNGCQDLSPAVAGLPSFSASWVAVTGRHLLRHGCGYRLVNQGMDTLSLAAYLGHANIQNTARYTKMNATRFDGLWRD